MQPSRDASGQKSRPQAWPLDILTDQPSDSARWIAASMAGCGCRGRGIHASFTMIVRRHLTHVKLNQSLVLAFLIHLFRWRRRATESQLPSGRLTASQSDGSPVDTCRVRMGGCPLRQGLYRSGVARGSRFVRRDDATVGDRPARPVAS